MLGKLNARKIFTAGLLTGGLFLSSCSLFGSDDPEVKDLKVSPSTIKNDDASSTASILGEASGDTMSISFKVTGASDVDMTDDFTISFIQPGAGKSSWDFGDDGKGTIKAKCNASAGTYALVTTVSSASKNASLSANFTVTGTPCSTEPNVTEQSVTLGSNQNNLGGSVDLDSKPLVAISYSQVKNDPSLAAKIDLYYGYSDVAQKDMVLSASAAKAGLFGTATLGPKNWTNVGSSMFVAITAPEYNAIQLASEMTTLWAAGTAVDQLDVNSSTAFICKTTAGKYVAVMVSSQTPGKSGTMSLKAVN